MELLLHQWEDWPELYRNTDKTEATEIVIIDSQINYRGKLDTYTLIPYPSFFPFIYAIINNTNYSIHKIHFPEEENDEASGNCDDC